MTKAQSGDGSFGLARTRLLLQRIPLDRPAVVRPLYWRVWRREALGNVLAGVDHLPNGALEIENGVTLSFDTYFGAFFEQHWRLHTRLRDLILHVSAQGRYELRVLRRTPDNVYLLHEQTVDGEGPVRVTIAPEALNFRQHGFLYLEITARDARVSLFDASWWAEQEDLGRPGLAVVFCTFNRDADIARNLCTLAHDAALMERLARVYVVSQGRPGLDRQPAIAPVLARHGDKVRLVEQKNFGGAGGFGRGLIEAIDDEAVTHVAFLDDDIEVEPDSLLRMVAFFALAKNDIPVGGHMLDSVQPLRLFEAGAIINGGNWTFQPQHSSLEIAHPESLARLLNPSAVHYNGWWCLGFSLRLLEQTGMPLPVFIRGDDVEFGIRLYERGIHTLPLPGVAVWHEPFYLKIGSWQLYYETRNMLITAVLHFGLSPRGVTVRMAKHLLTHLLTFRYYSSALIVRGIQDFMRGPAILRESPQALHASLVPFAEQYPTSKTPRGRVLPPLPVPPMPRRAAGFALAMARILLRNALRPSRPGAPHRLEVGNFVWIVLGRADHVAVDTWWDYDLPTFHRSREAFREIGWSGLTTLAALYRGLPGLAASWRDASRELTTVPSWRRYLGLRAEPGPEKASGAPEIAAAPSPEVVGD